MLGIKNWLLPVGMCLLAGACGPNVYNSIDLMPSPAIFADGRLDPFEGISSDSFAQRAKLFYATDRQPAQAERFDATNWHRGGHSRPAGRNVGGRAAHIAVISTHNELQITRRGNRRDGDHAVQRDGFRRKPAFYR